MFSVVNMGGRLIRDLSLLGPAEREFMSTAMGLPPPTAAAPPRPPTSRVSPPTARAEPLEGLASFYPPSSTYRANVAPQPGANNMFLTTQLTESDRRVAKLCGVSDEWMLEAKKVEAEALAAGGDGKTLIIDDGRRGAKELATSRGLQPKERA